MPFPNLEAANLAGHRLSLPGDFEGDVNMVLVAYQRWQQGLLDTWASYLESLEREIPGVTHYELPVIRRLDPLSRAFINGGMRAGIQEERARERTITLYVDKGALNEALGIGDEETVHILAVTKAGEILWHEQGRLSLDKARSLEASLAQRGLARSGQSS